MSKQRRSLGWWPLGLILLGFGALAFIEGRAHLTTAGRMVAQLAGVLVIYGLLFVWLHVNQGAYLRETYEELARRTASTTALEPEPRQNMATDLELEPGQNVATEGALDPIPNLHRARKRPVLASYHTPVED